MPTFTIMGSGIGYSGGNYKNEQPGQAAKKAGKALFKKLTLRKFSKYKNKPTIKFVLRMRDRSSAGKTYSYMVTRIKLAKPLLIKKGPVEYEVKYDYKIESCNLSPMEVKTMTGGEYALVGGRITATGMKKTLGGGDKDEEHEAEEEEDEDDEEDGGDGEEEVAESFIGGRGRANANAKAKAIAIANAKRKSSVANRMSLLSLR
jgi:hypothetical protein